MLRLGPEGRHGHLQLEKDWTEHSGKPSLATTGMSRADIVNDRSVSVGKKIIEFLNGIWQPSLILYKNVFLSIGEEKLVYFKIFKKTIHRFFAASQFGASLLMVNMRHNI